jgi:thiazole synthase
METTFENFKDRIERSKINKIPRDAKLIILGQILYAVTRNELSEKQGWELEEMLGGREEWEDALAYAIFGEAKENV